jgi:gentisate 1,2-dioxygenase
MTLDKLGNWPTDSKKARETGVLYAVKRDEVLRTIHGAEHPVLINFFISTDYGHVAEMILPSGGHGPRASDTLSHGSDAMLYGLEGTITVFIPAEKDTFVIERDEAVFIPANTEYQVLNYGGTVVKGLLTVGPKL